MSLTKINVGSVVGLSPTVMSAYNNVSYVKNSFNSTRSHIDSKILSRNNIGNRLSNISNQLNNIGYRILDIKNTVENGANEYYRTDVRIIGMKNTIIHNVSEVGRASGLYNTIGSEIAKQALEKEKAEEKDSSEFSFEKFLKDDWKLEAAILSGKKTGSGSFLGLKTEGTAEGDFIGGSIETKSKAKWNPKDGEIGIEKDIEAEGHVAKGKLEGSIGYLAGEIDGSVGNVGAVGTIGATLMKDNKFVPSVEIGGKAEASVAKGNAEIRNGTEENNIHIGANGSVLDASAEAKSSVGFIKVEDPQTHKLKTKFGIEGKAGAEACAAKGEISGGISIFGIKIEAGVSGKAGAVGAGVGGSLTTGGVSGKIDAALVLGLGVEINIDWSDFSLWD